MITAGAAALARPAAAAAPDILSGERLFLDVSRYAAFGVKRTATPEDRAVATWLKEEATAAGAQAATPSFTLRQFMLHRSVLVVDGRAIDNQPFWFPKATSGVLTAPLTADLAQAAGKILLVVAESGLAGLRQIPPLTSEAAQAGAFGLVIVQRTPSGQFYGHGRPPDAALPTLLVGDANLDRLLAAAGTGSRAAMEIAGEIVPTAQGLNVSARVPGPGKLCVVTTPISAWTTAAGERGPGVALWLALLRRAVQMRSANWLFLAWSGHEMDGAALRPFIAGPEAPRPQDVRFWCHLGASIAVRRFARRSGGLQPTEEASTLVRLLTNQPSWTGLLTETFAGRTHFRPEVVDASGARGELQLYFAKGYPAFGFEGGHDYFHAPGDLANVTSPTLLGRVGEALELTMRRFGA